MIRETKYDDGTFKLEDTLLPLCSVMVRVGELEVFGKPNPEDERAMGIFDRLMEDAYDLQWWLETN